MDLGLIMESVLLPVMVVPNNVLVFSPALDLNGVTRQQTLHLATLTLVVMLVHGDHGLLVQSLVVVV